MSSSDTPETPGQEERVAIQEAILQRLEEERALKLAQERHAQREKREQEYQAQKKAKLERAATQKQKRVAAFSQSQAQVSASIQEAARSLKKAIRAATEVKFPRHSPEGLEQKRLIQSLERALGGLKGVRLVSLSGDFDPDVDDIGDVE